MLQCSVCSEKPTRKCNTCNGKLFCNKCSYIHFDYHIEKGTFCNFGKIQIFLSSIKMGRLKENIKQAIKVIESQKLKILENTSKTMHSIKNMMNLAFEELEKMKKKYEELYKKEFFDEKEFSQVEEIIKERLAFEYPFFGYIEGTLTKNSNAKKANNKRVSMEMLESEYKLYVEGHTSCINTIAVSNDSTLIASGSGLQKSSDNRKSIWSINKKHQNSSDNTIRVWNAKEKQQIAVFKGHTEPINSIVMTSDNHYIISGSNDKTIRIWNLLAERQSELVLKGHESRVSSVAITSDDKFIVSGSWDKTIRLWDMQKKCQEGIFLGHEDIINVVAVTNDKQFIVSGSGSELKNEDNTVRIWNLNDKRQETVFEVHR
ncbi:hypothetical protein SteCoe_31644 [Stentor coeruleus]|uniref:Uncharacterized protein n=1 Tax=Stentor coeruleus TaxID=5963 RepID=A0A1R2B0Y5_9CILI|nr:hypothetical protein SteCoe_31644 [Stentor coeruleus]